MEAPKIKVYGLRMTRKTYVIIQLFGFLWLLGLYLGWCWAKLDQHPHVLVRWFDAILLLAYLFGVVETVLMLRRFKRANEEARPKD